MKALHISASDRGGAGIAAQRLRNVIAHRGHWEATLYTLHPTAKETEALPLLQASNFTLQRLRMLIGRLLAPSRVEVWQSSNLLPSGLPKKLRTISGDLIHLHWPHDELLSISEFAQFHLPVVWTLHDCWAALTTAHYPVVQQNDGWIERKVAQQKRKVFPNLQWELVTPSHQLKDEVERSGLFPLSTISEIPHPIDSSIFHFAEKEKGRARFALNGEKPLLLFRYVEQNREIKGGDLISMLIQAGRHNCQWISFGDGEAEVKSKNWIHFGTITDQQKLALLYAAADLFVAPSRWEAFGMSQQEAIASGTPTIALSKTGPASFIKDGINGWLMESATAEALSQTIEQALSQLDKIDRKEISKELHLLHHPDRVGELYEAVYHRAVERGRKS